METLNIDCSSTYSINYLPSYPVSEECHVFINFSEVNDSILRELSLLKVKDLTFVNTPPDTIESLSISSEVSHKILPVIDSLFPSLKELSINTEKSLSEAKEYNIELPSTIRIAKLHYVSLSSTKLPEGLQYLAYHPLEEVLTLPRSLKELMLLPSSIRNISIRNNLNKLLLLTCDNLEVLGVVRDLDIASCRLNSLKLNYPEEVKKLCITPDNLHLIDDCTGVEELNLISCHINSKDGIDLSHFDKLISLTVTKHLIDEITFPESLLYLNGSSINSTIVRSKFNKDLPLLSSKEGIADIEYSPGGVELCINCSSQVDYVAVLDPTFKATLKFTSMDKSILKSITLYGNPDIDKPDYLPEGVTFNKPSIW